MNESTESQHYARSAVRIEIVWHPDYLDGEEFAIEIFRALAFDTRRPVEVKPGLSVRFWTSPRQDLLRENLSEPTAVVVLIDDSMLESSEWEEWLTDISSRAHPTGEEFRSELRVMPIPVQHDIYANIQQLGQLNFLPAPLTGESNHRYLINQIMISLLSFLDPDRLYYDVFISYARSDGKPVRDQLMKAFEKYPYLRPFVDDKDMIVGAMYRARFESVIESSAFLAIQTDQFSSRTETVREFIFAKKKERPIVIVDALQEGEPRTFAYLGNNRVVRFDDSSDSHLLIQTLLTEILCYELFKLEANRLRSRATQTITICNRSPDLHSFLELDRDLLTSKGMILYPDPPLTYPELSALQSYASDCHILTPVQYWCLNAKESHSNEAGGVSPLEDLRIQLSVSPPGDDVLEERGFRSIHVEEWLIEFARYLFAAGATIVFGGKFSSDSVGAWILRILEVYGHSETPQNPRLRAFLPFPISVSLSNEERETLGNNVYLKAMRAPDNVRSLTKDGSQMPRKIDSPEWKQVWIESLSETRQTIAKSVDATIVIGGKETKYLGRYAGVVEEAVCALEEGNPLFVAGGLGGCALTLFKAIHTTTAWSQCGQSLAPHPRLKTTLRGTRNKKTALVSNGLTPPEIHRLGNTTDLKESINFVLNGLTTIADDLRRRRSDRKEQSRLPAD